MRRALAEREARLADRWTPLTNPHEVAGMDADEVLGRWADAHAAHGTDTTRADLETARTAGAHRLAVVAPERLAAWNALQTAQPTPGTGLGARPGLSPADAAARTAGRPSAFLPGPGGAHAGWERGRPARGAGGRHGGADDRRVDQPHRDRGPGRREGRPARPVPDQPRHAPVSTNPGVPRPRPPFDRRPDSWAVGTLTLERTT